MRQTQSGFSLVEILIALLILGLGILTLFNLFPLGFQALAYSRRLNETSLLAQKKIEELKSQDTVAIGQTNGSDGDLRWNISAKSLPLGEGINVVFLELNIEFDFQGKPLTQKFVTYLNQNK